MKRPQLPAGSGNLRLFVSYSKSALKNSKKDIKRKLSRKEKKEKKVIQSIRESIGSEEYYDIYPSERYKVFAGGLPCVVQDEVMYAALMSLPELSRNVVLLDFWHGYTDEEIAEYLGVVRKTIHNHRQRAFAFIKEYYERKEKDAHGTNR